VDRAELIAVLLSWAASLSGYPYPDTAPPVEYRGREFFVEHACEGEENCRVAAWYNDGTIYLDRSLDDPEDPVARSVVVHELVHYLQDRSGKFPVKDCESDLRREQEAYSIQRTYLNRIAGRFASLWPVWGPCTGSG
jgi:hypothetical protein